MAVRKAQPVRKKISYTTINRAALENLPFLISRWLPDGKMQGREWVTRNPRRNDRDAGSFCINVHTGRWADFAVSGVRGGDIISLAAYLADISQHNAACNLASMLGFSASEVRQ